MTQQECSFFIKSKTNEKTYQGKIISTEDKIEFFLRDEMEKKEDFFTMYKSIYSLSDLLELNDLFKVFASAEEIKRKIVSSVDSADIIPEPNQLKFVFYPCEATSIELPIKKHYDFKLEEIKKLNELNSGLSTKLTASEKRNEELLGEYAAIIKENEKLKKENENLKQILSSKNNENIENGQFTEDQTKLMNKISEIIQKSVVEAPNRRDSSQESLCQKIDELSRNITKKFQSPLLEMKVLKTIAITNTDQINSICLLRDGRLASGSGINTIEIFDLSSGKKEMTLRGHEDTIVSLCVLDNGYLVSSSIDGKVKIWEIKKRIYNNISTLEGHTNEVQKVIALSNDRIGSCSYDKTVRIWSASPPYECIKVLEGHRDAINTILEVKNKKYIISVGSGEDSTLRFWNNKTYECEKIVKEVYCSSWNGILELKDGKVLIGGDDEIAVVNVNTFCLETIIKDDNLGFTSCFYELGDGNVLCGSARGFVYHMNALTFEISYRKRFHENDMLCMIKINEHEVASCSKDKSIKLLSL